MAWNEIRHRARLVKAYGPVPPVEGSESRLGQVVLNLLVNAAHAITEGSAEQNEIRVTTSTDAEGRAVLEVRDTGGGIAPGARQRIFDPFFTTKEIGVGTGLGLSICHGIVSAMGGTIAVDSQPGAGSLFRVVLPPASAAPPASRFAAPAAAPPRRCRILVVDDEPLIAAMLRRTLAPDHEVVAAESGREALHRLVDDRERFDLVLCDLMMPEMTGMEVHAALARSAPDEAERLVFVTGGAFTPRAQAFLAGVPNRCIDKPIDVLQLRALVQGLFV
jgi:CheY-like chemotaxis protein